MRTSVLVRQRGEGISCLPLSGNDSAISHPVVDHTCHSQMPASALPPGEGGEGRGGDGLSRFRSGSSSLFRRTVKPDPGMWSGAAMGAMSGAHVMAMVMKVIKLMVKIMVRLERGGAKEDD